MTNVTRVTEWIQSIWIRFKEKTRRTNWMNVQWLTETKVCEWMNREGQRVGDTILFVFGSQIEERKKKLYNPRINKKEY